MKTRGYYSLQTQCALQPEHEKQHSRPEWRVYAQVQKLGGFLRQEGELSGWKVPSADEFPAVSKLQMLMQVVCIRDFLGHHVSLLAAGTAFLRVLSEVPP